MIRRALLIVLVLLAGSLTACGQSGKGKAEVCMTRLDNVTLCGPDLRAFCQASDGLRQEALAVYAGDRREVAAIVKQQRLCDEARA